MNMEEACSSPWSVLSSEHEHKKGVKPLSLYDIIQKYNDDETLTDEQNVEMKKYVAAIGTENLKAAILADDDYRGNKWGNISKLKDLENKAGGTATIDVSAAPEWLTSLGTDGISVIGANLNSETGNAELSIGQADEGTVPPALYKNALKFSMTLDNAGDTDDIKIPVRIILPVPDDIDPAFLVMLHFHKDGTYEEVPGTRVFTKDGKKYISIVLTSFSDFAVAERSFDITSVNVDNKTIGLYTGGADGTLTAAVYNEKGQMIESFSVDAGDRSEITLTSEKLRTGYTIKLFYMDHSKKPLYEAKEMTV